MHELSLAGTLHILIFCVGQKS